MKELYWFNKDIIEPLEVNDVNNKVEIIKATENIEIDIPHKTYTLTEIITELNNTAQDSAKFKVGVIVDEKGRTRRCVAIADESEVLSIGGSFFDHLDGIEYTKLRDSSTEKHTESTGVEFKLHPKATEVIINRNPQWRYELIETETNVYNWNVYFKEQLDDEEIYLGTKNYDQLKIVVEEYYMLPSHRKHLYSIMQKDGDGNVLVQKVQSLYSEKTERKLIDLPYEEVFYLGTSDDARVIIALSRSENETKCFKIEDNLSEEMIIPFVIKNAKLSSDGEFLTIQKENGDFNLLETKFMQEQHPSKTPYTPSDVSFVRSSNLAYYQTSEYIVANILGKSGGTGDVSLGNVAGKLHKATLIDDIIRFFTINSVNYSIDVYEHDTATDVSNRKDILLNGDVYEDFTTFLTDFKPKIDDVHVSDNGNTIVFTVVHFFEKYENGNYVPSMQSYKDLFIYEHNKNSGKYTEKLKKRINGSLYYPIGNLDGNNYYLVNKYKDNRFYEFNGSPVCLLDTHIESNNYCLAETAKQIFYILKTKNGASLYTKAIG